MKSIVSNKAKIFICLIAALVYGIAYKEAIKPFLLPFVLNMSVVAQNLILTFAALPIWILGGIAIHYCYQHQRER